MPKATKETEREYEESQQLAARLHISHHFSCIAKIKLGARQQNIQKSAHHFKCTNKPVREIVQIACYSCFTAAQYKKTNSTHQ